MWFSNRYDINQPVQAQDQARSLKFWIQEEEELYYPCSENKGADQLRSYCEADLRLWFRICRLLVFHEPAKLISMRTAYVRTIFRSVRIENSDLCVPCMQ